MKFRKLILVSAVCMAITASFAFKPAKQGIISVTFFDVYIPTECKYGATSDNCETYFTGARCTSYDPESDTYQPAFSNNDSFDMCEHPLYKQF
jgi:hypothetical protein